MKLLCLHGVGSSANVLENSLRPFLQAVDPAYEFVFVDGPVPSPRGPGVPAHIEGPFFSHTVGYSPSHMAEAIDQFEETIEELGPFDGVLGFSQGAALTISYLHQQETYQRPVPFNFALIFSSVLPCSSNPRHYQGILERVRRHKRVLTSPLEPSDTSATQEERTLVDLMQQTIIPARKKKAMLPDIDLKVYHDGKMDDAPRLMSPLLLKERIQIPTVHVVGKQDFDFMRNMSDAARGLCNERMLRKLEHGGSHHPPKKDAEIKAVIRAMDWAIAQSRKMPTLHL